MKSKKLVSETCESLQYNKFLTNEKPFCVIQYNDYVAYSSVNIGNKTKTLRIHYTVAVIKKKKSCN